MADLIYVRPAREGLLVPFAPHRPGQFIGMRRARDGEMAHVSVDGGHRYVSGSPERVERTAYIVRRLLQGDLVEVVPTEAAPSKRSAAKETP